MANIIKKTILAIAIAIILSFFINIGIETFFPSPEYEDFCSFEPYEFREKNTQEICESKGGNWTTIEKTSIDSQITCTKLSEDNDTINLQCTELALKTTGYCNENQECRNKYEESNKNYTRNKFVAILIIGIILITIGIALKLASVSSGLMSGAVITMLFSMIEYWRYSSDVLRFGLLGIILGILIYLGYKKLNE